MPRSITILALVAGVVALCPPTADAKPKKQRAKVQATEAKPAPAPAKTDSASDQDADAAACKQNDDTTTCWFEDDVVGGEALSPTGHNVNSRTHLEFKSLITIRGHFIPELVQLARDL